MPDFRCFCDTPDAGAETIELSLEESQHLVAANRAREGDAVVAFDGVGAEWPTTLERANKRNARLRIAAPARSYPPPPPLALALALPKGKTFESIVKKATELGASALYPVVTQRVEVKVAPEKEGSKNAKWQAAAIEGAKQSGNPWLPRIAPVTRLSAFLEQAAAVYDARLVASLQPNSIPLKEAIGRVRQGWNLERPLHAICLIGPEGDLAPEETEAALEAGFQPITLGPWVLRCETAAVAALCGLRHELA